MEFCVNHFGWYLTPERIVVLVYLFSIVCVLLGLLLGVLFFNSSGRQVFIILTVPFSTLFFLPIFHIPVFPMHFWLYELYPGNYGQYDGWINFFSWGSSPLPAPLGFLVIVGWLGLLLFYPLVSLLLWNRFRVGWGLSLFAAVSTIGLSLYEAFVGGFSGGWPSLAMADCVFGVAANSAILLLLWRCTDAFFKPRRPWLARKVQD